MSERSLRERIGPRRAVLVVTAFAALFVLATLAPPLLRAVRIPGGASLHAAFAPLCHQSAERSLPVGPGRQAVCARCCGLYVGGVLGLILAGTLLVGSSRWPRPAWLLWVAAPTVLDALLGFVGLPSLPNLPRLFLAIPAGAVAGIFLAQGIADLCRHRATRFVSTVATLGGD